MQRAVMAALSAHRIGHAYMAAEYGEQVLARNRPFEPPLRRHDRVRGVRRVEQSACNASPRVNAKWRVGRLGRSGVDWCGV